MHVEHARIEYIDYDCPNTVLRDFITKADLNHRSTIADRGYL